jgi:hypothetical protein
MGTAASSSGILPDVSCVICRGNLSMSFNKVVVQLSAENLNTSCVEMTSFLFRKPKTMIVYVYRMQINFTNDSFNKRST